MTEDTCDRKVVYISAITSDIGIALAKRYQEEGWECYLKTLP